MVTSIVSVLIKTPVRKDIAMTAKSLRGNAMPIGGLAEKNCWRPFVGVSSKPC
jgi:ATP-dependent Lon protease